MLASSEILIFGDFRLDRRGGGLFRRDDSGAYVPVAIGSRALDILGVLVARPGELVSKEEITAAVWPAMIVEDSNLTVQISALRRVLDRGRAQGSVIQTVAGRGYRFLPAVTRPGPQPGWGTPREGPPALALPDKPSIAVLPFSNISGDPEQEYFADGMVEEIITALSRIRWLFVIARNSSFTYKGHAIEVKQIGRDLGVRYVLEGSVRKAGGRVRITTQLIDATNGAQLWADRFDGSLEDVFELQDNVAISAAGVIEPTLHAAEIARSSEHATTDLTAYDLYLRAHALAFSWEKIATIRSLKLIEQAIECDPRYGPALAQAAARHFELHVNAWTDDLETSRRKGIELSRQALQVAGDDPTVLCNVAYILGYFGEDIEVAIALVDRGLKLNPSASRGWQWSGWLRAWAGELDQAIEHFEASLRLNPREQRANPFLGIGVAHFFAGRREEARATLLRSLQEKPNWVPTYRFLASCCAHMGHLDEAREVASRLRAMTNALVPSAENWRDPMRREFYLSGLRLAVGGEEASRSALSR